MPALIALMLLALPVAEIAMFIVVGSHIGVLATIALILASAVAGAALLRFQGLGAMARMRAALEAGEAPAREIADGMMILLAGLLLITPGFITGALGVLLFVPPLRQLFWKLAGLKVAVYAARRGPVGGYGGGYGGEPGGERVVDLGRDEYVRQPRGRLDGRDPGRRRPE